MASGAEAMEFARFFDAEDRYVRAMAARRGDPMAAVGRIHAQIGAGLFLSASHNLTKLYQSHPELVAVRYGGTVLPSDSRLGQIKALLRGQLDDPASGLGRDAALLLAYIGYQQDERSTLEEGLDELVKRTDPERNDEVAQTELVRGVVAESDGG